MPRSTGKDGGEDDLPLKDDSIVGGFGSADKSQIAQASATGTGNQTPAPDPKRIGDPTYLYDWPGNTLTPEFRDAIAKAETNTKGYRELNLGTAWGRYQMTKFGLQEAGMKDVKGGWTGKHGVNNEQDFLNDPVAQEKAFAEYMRKTVNQLGAKGAFKHLGQSVDGIKGRFTINRDNLAAAAHRHGAGGVNKYLNFLARKNKGQLVWKCQIQSELDKDTRNSFFEIETRLRTFENVKYKKK